MRIRYSNGMNTAGLLAVFMLFSLFTQAQNAVQVYDAGNSGLPDNAVRAIEMDGQGRIWTGTDWGLARLDAGNWTVFQTSNSDLPDNSVRSLEMEGDSAIWIGTFSGGLSRFNGSSWLHFTTQNSPLPSDHVRSLAWGSGGELWIGTAGGLVKKKGSDWTIWDFIGEGFESNNVGSLLAEGPDTCWAGMINGGLIHVEDTTITSMTISTSGIPDNTITGIAKDAGEDLWCATPAAGLAYFQNGLWLNYSTFNSGNPTNTVNTLVLDEQENRWMGSIDKGVIYYAGNVFSHFDPSNSGIPEANVRCLLLDTATGTLWGGTNASGLFAMDTDLALAGAKPRATALSLHPNPNAGDFRLELPVNWVNGELSVYNLQGKLMLRTHIGQTREKVETGLPPGNYLVQLQNGGQIARGSMLVR